jgi:hypothetical protein
VKRVAMTRARQEALPAILTAARAATRHVPMTDAQRRELNEALEAFK